MAPKILDDDDFVHTISDNDSVAPESEEEEEQLPSASKNKKRKRDSVDGKAEAGSKKSKKQKKDKKKKGKKDKVDEDGDEDMFAEEGVSGEEDADIASDFEFAAGDLQDTLEDFDGWGVDAKKEEEKKSGAKAVDVDAIIERRKQNKQAQEEKKEEPEEQFEGFGSDDELLAEDGFGMGAGSADEDSEGDEDEEEKGSGDEAADDDEDEDSEAEGSDDEVAAPVAHPLDMEGNSSDEEEEDEAEKQRRADFFASEDNIDGLKQSKTGTSSFQSMSLSRPILKGLAAVGFAEPTPIQAKTIPVALLGKDVVGSAETGSGKTGAFMIPILERLLYRPKKVPTTRVAVLMPTRELAVQCYNVSRKLASFTDITFAQIVGGFSLREQENVLKTRPDVVIATPGRFIDHVRNSPSFAVDTLEILVLDEADRMLEEGFADELNEIINSIPKSRQTMLFSATMTESIDKLIRVGLNRPVRLQVNAKKQTVAGLVQEFIRLRPGREEKRLAYLMYLCDKVYTDRVIIFFRQKKEAHRIRIIFGLCGLKAGELHGSMSQEQRINAIESFRSGSINFLLATDLASRGLDIKNVNVVLNYTTPQTHEIYLHRVGRTARAGRTGHACTLAAEPDRKVVRAAVKAARAQGAKVVSRSVPNEEVDKWDKKIRELDEEVEEVLREEKEEKALSNVERDLTKGENLIKYEKEIKARPKRTWFETEKEKKEAKMKGKIELNGESAVKKEKRKLSGKEKKKLEDKDIRREGGVWKKGKEERAGKGVLAEARKKGKGKGDKGKGGGKKGGKGK